VERLRLGLRPDCYTVGRLARAATGVATTAHKGRALHRGVHARTLLFQTLLVDDGFASGLPRYTSLLSTPRAPSPFGALLSDRCAA
jgi:hypothetical protein